ncbi:PREDICTED: p21-activated protein kinase-interacting protein 1-like [Polistes dominula]|uniref:P21-activated protein kinase-interacting protein 1-like n=1 Tax=Polistes dominula TaxID=743375 RepID=A0ABM1I0V8_POLDO|nr:PREDICTED: p21-activated protein kinase-interacting protein 1-like [Polistes dominula]
MQINLNTPNLFEIIVGTYEQYLLGYKFTNIVNEYKLEKSFATHSHLGSIRSVASNKYYLASAGADETICLYDLRNRIESGKLMHHNDTVNNVTFTSEASHLFSCSKDGTIAAVRCGNWQMQKHWMKPHKGLSVHTLAIHPTGKLALSTGADGILRTWNLVKGRQAYATNLVPRLKSDAKDITVLKWSPNGEKYLLAANQQIDIFSVQLAGIDQEVQLDSKVVCVEFLKDDLIAVGLENGHIKFYDLEKLAYTLNILAHDIRIKCMAYKDDLLVTASSNGEIKLWRFTRNKVDMLQSINCGARITCLTLAELYQNVVHKKETDLNMEEKVKNKNKFRLKQEVIVEDNNDDDDDDDNSHDDEDDDDDWEVTSVDNSNINLSIKSKNNSTSAEWIETDANSSGKLNTNGQLSKNNQRNKRSIDSIENFSPSPKKKTLNEDRNNNSNSSSNSNNNSNSNKKKDVHIKKRKVEETEQDVSKTSFIKRKKTIKTDTESDSKVQKKKKKNWLEESSKKVSKKIKEEERPVPSKNIAKKDTESVKKREKWKIESLKVEEKNKKISKKRKTIEDECFVSSNKTKKKKQ